MAVGIRQKSQKKKIGSVFHEAILNSPFTLIDQTTSRELYKKPRNKCFKPTLGILFTNKRY